MALKIGDKNVVKLAYGSEEFIKSYIGKKCKIIGNEYQMMPILGTNWETWEYSSNDEFTIVGITELGWYIVQGSINFSYTWSGMMHSDDALILVPDKNLKILD